MKLKSVCCFNVCWKFAIKLSTVHIKPEYVMTLRARSGVYLDYDKFRKQCLYGRHKTSRDSSQSNMPNTLRGARAK